MAAQFCIEPKMKIGPAHGRLASVIFHHTWYCSGHAVERWEYLEPRQVTALDRVPLRVGRYSGIFPTTP